MGACPVAGSGYKAASVIVVTVREVTSTSSWVLAFVRREKPLCPRVILPPLIFFFLGESYGDRES